MNIEAEITRIHELRQQRVMNLDYETQSVCDLIKRGAYIYSMDPSTKVLVACYRFCDDPPDKFRVWIPATEDMPNDFRDHIVRGGLIIAYNAQFEYLITRYVLKLDISIWQMSCTAAQGRACALPGSLGKLARATEIPYRKDSYGNQLISLYSLPKADGSLTPWVDIPPADQDAWVHYCVSDVRLESTLAAYLMPLTDRQVVEYQFTEMLNGRGICLDVGFAEDVVALSSDLAHEINMEIGDLTDGVVEKSTSQKGRDAWLMDGYWFDVDAGGKWRWVHPRDCEKLPKSIDLKTHQWIDPLMTPEQIKHLRKHRTKLQKDNDELGDITFDKRYRADLLAANAADLVTLDERVLDYFELLEEAGGATISKFTAMLDRGCAVGDEWVLRGAYMFAGAGQTGRFSSTGFQLHNMRRAGVENVEAAIAEIAHLAERGDSADFTLLEEITDTRPMDAFAGLVRSSIIAAVDCQLVWGDWSSIEARVLPWLANTDAAEKKLDLFRSGRDPYIANASVTFGVPYEDVDKEQRFAGKVQELALGFAGGPGALQAMARAYGTKLTDRQCISYRDGWRAANPWAMPFWDQTMSAAWSAFRNPGVSYESGRLEYRYYPDIMGGTLFCALPSGRFLSYPGVREEEVYNEMFDEDILVLTSLAGNIKPKQGDKEWPRKTLWSGILVENSTQGCAADVLREAILRVEGEDSPIVAHTHDEMIIEVYDDTPERMLEWVKWLEEQMCKTPEWAEGLPLAAEGSHGYRYGK